MHGSHEQCVSDVEVEMQVVGDMPLTLLHGSQAKGVQLLFVPEPVEPMRVFVPRELQSRSAHELELAEMPIDVVLQVDLVL